jgi:epoxide hydrolase-like predicted phosphatase
VPQTIDAVLFDFGGVFTDSPFAAIDTLGRELGIPAADVMQLLFGPYDRDTDHPWHRLERGEIRIAEAAQEISALAAARGVPLQLERAFRAMGSGAVKQAVIDAARSVRASGIRTGLLTNNLAEFRDGWRRMLPVDELFEFVVDSSEVGVRKPDPAIFRIALDRLGGLPASRVAFLDDFPGNIRAARLLGMQAVLVEQDPGPALAELETLLSRR